MQQFSKAEIDRLGRRLRDQQPAEERDLLAYSDYREEFSDALMEVESELRRLAEANLPSRFRSTATRRKAVDSVIRKLRRKTGSLSSMQDIAGCRLTVGSLQDLTHIAHLMTDAFETVREKDYTQESRAGYRAYHLIQRASDGRLVEVQLRTEIQHAWANRSEALAYRIDRSIKAGGGPADVRKGLEDLSDQGRLIDETLDWVEISSGAFAEMRYFLEEREDEHWSIHPNLHVVDDIQSLLRVALHLHRELVDGFLWQLEDFEPTDEKSTA